MKVAIEVPQLPWCSVCCKSQVLVMSFLAFSSQHAAVTRHRGGSRQMRICEPCVRHLLQQLQKAKRRARRSHD